MKNAPGLALMALCGVALVTLVGCGGGGGPSFDSMGVSPDAFAARAGDTIRFHAYGVYANGNPGQEITSTVTWRSSNEAVALIATTGIFTAVAPGECDITASYAGVAPVTRHVTVEVPGSLPTQAWHPLRIGYRWTYSGTEVAPAGVAPRAATTLTISIERESVDDGLVWWELIVKGTDPAVAPNYMYLRHTADGLSQWIYGGLPVLKLKAPLVEGATWTDPNSDKHTFEILSTTESVAVEAGTYDNCVKVKEVEGRADVPTEVLVWFAEGVGIVKEQRWVSGELVEYQELTSENITP
jgi:hypothetical protein